MHETDAGALSAVLAKILDEGSVTSLSSDERAVLERVAGQTDPAGRGEFSRRPLWYWIRRRFWEVPTVLRQSFLEATDDAADAFYELRGLEPRTSMVAHLLAPFDRAELRSLVSEVVRSERRGAYFAAYVAGLAGFTDLKPWILAHTIEKDPFPIVLNPLEYLGPLMLLVESGEEFCSFIPADRDPQETLALRLHHIALHISVAAPDEICALVEEAMESSGLLAQHLAQHPELLAAYLDAGGDGRAVLGSLGEHWNAMASPPTFAPIARALLATEDGARAALGWSSQSLPSTVLLQLHMEAAVLGLREHLPLLERALARLDTPTLAEESGMVGSEEAQLCPAKTGLLVALGLLRPDGVEWLSRYQRSDADSREAEVARAVLSLGGEAGKEGRFLENPVVRILRRVGQFLERDRMEEALECLLELKDWDGVEVSWFLYLVERTAAELRDEDSIPLLEEAVTVLSGISPRGCSREFARLTYWARRSLDFPEVRDPVLAGAGTLPDEEAAPVLEALLHSQLSDGNPQMPLLEIGCLAVPEAHVGAFTASLLRLASCPPGASQELVGIDRGAGMWAILSPKLPVELRVQIARNLRDTLEGDAAGASLVYGGALRDGGGYQPDFLGRPAAEAVMDALVGEDSLAGCLSQRGGAMPEDPAHVARRLLTSPDARVRCRAVPIVFEQGADDEKCASLRPSLLHDNAETIRHRLLELVGHVPFDPGEVRLLFESVAVNPHVWLNEPGIAAIERENRSDHLDILFRLWAQRNFDSESAARAIGRILRAEEDAGVVFFSVAHPSHVSEAYHKATAGRVRISSGKDRAMPLLLSALEELRDPHTIEGRRGDRLLLRPVQAWPPDFVYGEVELLSQKEFERIAVHLEVLSVEEDSGHLIARVGAEPTGEILNAMFEELDAVCFQAIVT